MKEHYVQRASDLEEERDLLDRGREMAEQERDRAMEKIRQLKAQLVSASSSSPGSGSGDSSRQVVVNEVLYLFTFSLSWLLCFEKSFSIVRKILS